MLYCLHHSEINVSYFDTEIGLKIYISFKRVLHLLYELLTRGRGETCKGYRHQKLVQNLKGFIWNWACKKREINIALYIS